MTIKITTLSENTAGFAGLIAEHGLSILVETDDINILLDTGLDTSVCHNADALGIELKEVDKIVLSHGHHDHTGGLRQVLRRMRKKTEVIAHPDIWSPHAASRRGSDPMYVGIPFDIRELEGAGAGFTITREPVKITGDITTTGEIPMKTDYEQIDPHLVVKEGDDVKQDELLDDRALILNSREGLAVILGCAHRGIINTLYYAQELTGVKEIALVIGGCHLMGANEERVWRTIAALKELDVKKIGVSHCTGLPAAAIMAHEFGEGFFFNNTGTRIELD